MLFGEGIRVAEEPKTDTDAAVRPKTAENMYFSTGTGGPLSYPSQGPGIIAGKPCRIGGLYGNTLGQVFRTAVTAQSDFLFRYYSDPEAAARGLLKGLCCCEPEQIDAIIDRLREMIAGGA
ncbi:hypothetical protein [Azospirillum griseum]|uniref:Uncharacterized protein n=1 Tax=Azospirillum griseum TaxID=2496639 RepID=A0A431V9E5_9PROT|nr:hypothetical protein [Azospirillum griseum]RTR10383.1 hypothetical protein EJ903_26340 [Azospirillum griseum]